LLQRAPGWYVQTSLLVGTGEARARARASERVEEREETLWTPQSSSFSEEWKMRKKQKSIASENAR
jgi:hypothetical protein